MARVHSWMGVPDATTAVEDGRAVSAAQNDDLLEGEPTRDLGGADFGTSGRVEQQASPRRSARGERLALGAVAVAVAFVPVLKPGGPGNVAPVDLLMGVALFASLLWAGMSRPRLRFPFAVGAGLLVVGGSLGALGGPVPATSAMALLQDVWLLAWCWAIVNIASSAARLEVLVSTWAYAAFAWAAALAVGLFAGVTWLSGQTESEGERTALTLGDPSYAASYFFVSIMLIWASGIPRSRGVRLCAYALLVFAVLSTGSNSGIISLVVGVTVAGVAGVWRRRGPLAGLVVGAFVLIGGLPLSATIDIEAIQESANQSDIAILREGIGRSEMSAANRDVLLAQSLDLLRTGGPLGQGPVSTKTRLDEELAPLVKEAHDDYLAAILERGLLGALGLLVLLCALLWRTATLPMCRLVDGYGAVVRHPNALLGALGGTMVAMLVYELLHVRHVWAFFALLAAVSIWGKR